MIGQGWTHDIYSSKLKGVLIMCQSTVSKQENLYNKANLKQSIKDEMDMWRILFQMYEDKGIVSGISNK